MYHPPPAEIGMTLDEVDTPALIVDLDAFESNVAQMADDARRAGVRVRPHAKSHKCAVIARRQMAKGAIGVCCQKVSEAEALATAGVDNILVSNQVVGTPKLKRLAGLSKAITASVCVDNAENARNLSDAMVALDTDISVLVEIDVGSNRCGVLPGSDAVELANVIASLPGLRFGGLQAYQGRAQHLRTHREREDAITAATAQTRETVALLQAAGHRCETIGGAGTGTYEFESVTGIYNELQVGSYIFMDADYAKNLDAAGEHISHFQHSLFLLATVMSYPSRDRALLDAGLKAMSFDSGLPTVHQRSGIEYIGASDEHGKLALDGANDLKLGDKVRLIPGHCDPTVNMHDWYVALRNGVVEGLWPIVARGAIF
ncbi:MAG: DSD1 family PLP-dependent enzyme [Pseudomonadota bacterium]